MVSEGSYFAHGKLMLLGEFFVLRGADCISAPSHFGQTLNVLETGGDTLKWEATIQNELWFFAEYDLREFVVKNSSNNFLAESFARLARVTRELNPAFLQTGATVKTNLTFPQQWGLGSSSTIIKLLGEWANVDPFKIHFATSNGSGYDIASAMTDKPIIYSCTDEVPLYKPVVLPEVVKQHCYFIYLGKKQNSQKSVKLFLQRVQADLDISLMNNLVEKFIRSNSVKEICEIMRVHDEMLSPVLEMKRVKEVAFRDFEGEVKSLGAWGGDFVMACSENEEQYIRTYFESKGLDSIFTYRDLLL